MAPDPYFQGQKWILSNFFIPIYFLMFNESNALSHLRVIEVRQNATLIRAGDIRPMCGLELSAGWCKTRRCVAGDCDIDNCLCLALLPYML